MQDTLIGASRNTLLLGVCLLLALFVGFFRLDELLFRSKKPKPRQRPKTATVRKGVAFISDDEEAHHDSKNRRK